MATDNDRLATLAHEVNRAWDAASLAATTFGNELARAYRVQAERAGLLEEVLDQTRETLSETEAHAQALDDSVALYSQDLDESEAKRAALARNEAHLEARLEEARWEVDSLQATLKESNDYEGWIESELTLARDARDAAIAERDDEKNARSRRCGCDETFAPFDSANYLTTPEDLTAYREALTEERDGFREVADEFVAKYHEAASERDDYREGCQAAWDLAIRLEYERDAARETNRMQVDRIKDLDKVNARLVDHNVGLTREVREAVDHTAAVLAEASDLRDLIDAYRLRDEDLNLPRITL